jgi:hypothetical protein
MPKCIETEHLFTCKTYEDVIFCLLLGCNAIKEGEMRRAITHMGEVINAHKILVGKPDGNRPLGRPTHRWEENNGWILGK